MPDERPRSAPPITSVVQCSPRLTLDINMATLNRKRKTLINTFKFLFILDLIIR